jgi:putative heme-binding domain-containing protein
MFKISFIRSAQAIVCGIILATLAASVRSSGAAGLSAAATPVGQLKVAKGFKVELLYTVPKDQQGSWVAMCTDPKGRLIVSDQYGKLYRLTPPPIGTAAEPKIETIDLDIGRAHGLLYAFDSLYVMVNENPKGRGLYRVRDTNGDDIFDEVKLLRKLDGGGEHGVHAVLLSPDGKSLHIIAGDATRVTEFASSRVPLRWSEDHLLPRLWDGNGFMKGVLAPGGWIAKTDPDGKSWELISSGYRNQYDAAFNRHGDLFTYDADMEWDLNTPWYRPTRVNHATSGSEFGWRSGAGKWPAYHADSLGAVVNVGPGSPTGVTFGYGAKFPAKYQEALFLCDWSFGKLYAAHLTPDGSSYRATLEEFVTGQPLPLTDIVINKDGAMYFAIGGRKTQSALYRVTYAGTESTAPGKGDNSSAQAREIRHKLESFHGHADPNAVTEAWKYLGDKDRAIRFAARVAIEWQDPANWREKALAEKNPVAATHAIIALARVSSKDQFHRKATDPKPDPALQGRMIEALDRIAWKRLSDAQRLDLLRAYTLTFTRLGKPDEETRRKLTTRFDPLFPSNVRELNAELCQMLIYLEAPSAATKVVAALSGAPTQEEQLEYARALRVLRTGWTPALRETYFRWFLSAANFKGGASLAGFLRDMKDDAMATLGEQEKLALKPILEAKPEKKSHLELLAARKFVKEWTVDQLAPTVERGLKGGRDFNRGRQLFGAAGCASCHRFDNEGAAVGPDLTAVSGRFNIRDLLESVIIPSKEVSDQYAAIVVKKKDGETVTGRVANLSEDTLMICENMFAPGDFTNVKRADIVSIEPSKISLMPEGLLSTLTEAEVGDLVAYLMSHGDRTSKMFRR